MLRRALLAAAVVSALAAAPAHAAFEFVTRWTPGGADGTKLPGFAIGKDRNLYIAREDQGSLAYIEVESPMEAAQPPGTPLKVFPHTPDNPGPSPFLQPFGVDTDSSDNVFVIDRAFQPSGTPKVDKFDADGVYKSQFGDIGTAEGQFGTPQDLEVTANGIYVADSSNHRVQQFDLLGNFVRMWGEDVGPGGADTCTSGCVAGTRDGGTPGTFSFPGSITSDADGNIYVTDTYTVQKFSKDGAFLLQIGNGAGNYYLHPDGVAVLPDGRILESDSGSNSEIRVFSSAGTYLEKFGTEGNDPGQFVDVGAISVDSLGYVYVLDNGSFHGGVEQVDVFKEPATGGGSGGDGGGGSGGSGGDGAGSGGDGTGGGSGGDGGGTPPPTGGGDAPDPPIVKRPTAKKTETITEPKLVVDTGVEVTCPIGGTCYSHIKAQTFAIGGVGRIVAAKRKRVTVGSATATIPGGSKKKLSFKLNKKGKKLIRKKHTLKVDVKITTTSAGTTPIVTTEKLTLKLKRKRHR